MTRRRGATAIASNPVLVGVATTLVVVVAVFLAYNANAGLPWIPTYHLTAQVPSAANLVKGNEVRIGGLRVGVVDKIDPVRRPDGTVVAKLDLKLQTSIKPLPADSTLIVRPRSALGLKYVQVTKGTSTKGFPDGAEIPLSSARPHPVEIDQFFSIFDRKTRRGSQKNLLGFGNGFAGRGQDLNSALQSFVPLVRNAVPALANIADPKTRFDRFFASQARTAAIVAPVAVTQAELWGNLDTTFIAFADVARPFIQESISKGPQGLDTAIETFPRIRPLFRNTQVFFHTLRPGARALRASVPDLADAFDAALPALKRSVGFNGRLSNFLGALSRFSQDPVVPLGFRDLFETVETLDPTIGFLAPAQTVCNYVNLWFRNVAGLLSDGDSRGTWARFMVISKATPLGPNSEYGPSSGPANGGGQPITGIDPNYLHLNPYPNTASPGQSPTECEAGNEPYIPGKQVIGNVPGDQGTSTDNQPSKKKSKE